MFREVLTDIAGKVDGTLALSLISLDGIAIDTIGDTDELHLDAIGAELGSFLKGIKQSSAEVETGEVEQFSLSTDRFHTILSSVTSEYFLLMILSRDGNYGRARYELRRAKLRLQDELI